MLNSKYYYEITKLFEPTPTQCATWFSTEKAAELCLYYYDLTAEGFS